MGFNFKGVKKKIPVWSSNCWDFVLHLSLHEYANLVPLCVRSLLSWERLTDGFKTDTNSLQEKEITCTVASRINLHHHELPGSPSWALYEKDVSC